MSGYVLIVDDERMIRDFIAKVLELNKVETLLAEDSEEAVGLFTEKKDSIDLALIDMSLPGIGGIDLIKSLLKLKPDLKIGLMSGYDQTEMEIQSASLPIAGFIRKPFRMNEIMQLVQPLVIERASKVMVE